MMKPDRGATLHQQLADLLAANPRLPELLAQLDRDIAENAALAAADGAQRAGPEAV